MPIDYNNYHPRWSLIRRLILKRADNKCEWCGLKNHEPHPVHSYKIVLTVAHIDHNKDNNRFSNLAALCQPCHLRHDKDQHTANRKYGKHHKLNQGKLEL